MLRLPCSVGRSIQLFFVVLKNTWVEWFFVLYVDGKNLHQSSEKRRDMWTQLIKVFIRQTNRHSLTQGLYTNCTIIWKVIYTVDIFIHALNYRGQIFSYSLLYLSVVTTLKGEGAFLSEVMVNENKNRVFNKFSVSLPVRLSCYTNLFLDFIKTGGRRVEGTIDTRNTGPRTWPIKNRR